MTALLIRERNTERVAERMDTTGMSERQVEKLERGIGINLDWENFYIDREED